MGQSLFLYFTIFENVVSLLSEILKGVLYVREPCGILQSRKYELFFGEDKEN